MFRYNIAHIGFKFIVYTECFGTEGISLKSGEHSIDFTKVYFDKAYGTQQYLEDSSIYSEVWIPVRVNNSDFYYFPLKDNMELEDGRLIDDVVNEISRAG